MTFIIRRMRCKNPMNQAMMSKWKPGGCMSAADVVFEFQNATLINNWLHEVDERQEELPSLWTAGRPVKRHFESWPGYLWSVLQSALSRAAKWVRQNAGSALTERHMQGYEWLHLRGNCCQAGASYLVSFSLLAIYGRSGSALRRRYLIWILMSSQVKLGLSGDPPGEEKNFTYDCFNSLCLIVNSLLQNKGERNINAIKGNGIMIPFAQSLKSFFTVL